MRVARPRLVLLVVVLVLAVGAVVVVQLVNPFGSSRIKDAAAVLPENVVRASFTDWASVKVEVGGFDSSGEPSDNDLKSFLDKAFEIDLTTASALSDSFAALQANFEITPLVGEWEIYGQSAEASIDVLKLTDEVDLVALEERFSQLGYQAPAEGAGTSGVWTGSADLVSAMAVPFGALQQNVAVVADERLLLMADSPESVADTLKVINGDETSLSSVAEPLLDKVGEPTAATLWLNDFACGDLAMSQADPTDVEAAAELIEKAGGVHPLVGLAFAQQSGLGLRVVMEFADDDQATEDLQARVDLASGDAPGQGGTFGERFGIQDAQADGSVVVMDLQPVDRPIYSDLNQGPVLFATC